MELGQGCSSSLPGILVPWTLLAASHLIVLQGAVCFFVAHGSCLASISSHPGGRVGGVSRLWPSCKSGARAGSKVKQAEGGLMMLQNV